MGSGVLIKKAIKKYGKENFSKEILEEFDSELDMYKRESEIVNEEFLKNENTYNQTLGGVGGGYFLKKWWDGLSDLEKEQYNKMKSLPGERNPMYGVSRKGENGTMYGKSHTEESKQKIAKTKINKMVAKDEKTGEIIGLVSVDHEKIKSGEWVSINAGRKASNETKEKLSKAKIKAGTKPPSCKGLVFWNNGEKAIRSAECPGEGWVSGRLKFKHKQKE